MIGIVVTPDGNIYAKDLQEPLHRSAGKTVGGHIEIVRPRNLPRPYCMVVNEEFLLLRLPLNPVGCALYDTHQHGHPICGNIIILKEQGEYLVGLDPKEQKIIKEYMWDIEETEGAPWLWQLY